jgi:hypothetical protein
MALSDSVNLICQTLADYTYYHEPGFIRQHGVAGIQPYHVLRWLEQFDSAKREDFAQAFANVISKSYISKDKVQQAANLLLASNLVSNNDANFFQNVSFLDIQQNGQSQTEFLHNFIIPEAQSLSIPCAINDLTKTRFLYFDDVLFSGGRAKVDLEKWINTMAPQSCEIICVFIFTYSYGEYNISKWLKKAISNAGKNINFRLCRMKTLNNNRTFKEEVTDVFHPREVPVEASTYYDEMAASARYQILREYQQSAPSLFFSNETERYLLEEQFVIAGMCIRNQLNKKGNWKPLGSEGFPSFGFGSTIVTYRNCPNISPLALWWGEQDSPSIWYPLVPRKGYSDSINAFLDALPF